VRLGPTLLGVSATGRTARGTSSAVAKTAPADRAKRRPLPLPIRPAQPRRRRRRLCAYRIAAPAPSKRLNSAVAELSAPTASVAPRISAAKPIPAPAPPTVSAAAVSAMHSSGFPTTSNATLAAALAAPAPPANSAVADYADRTEPVAATVSRSAWSTMTAVVATAPTTAVANFQSLPNSFPRTRSGHSASVAAPAPAAPSPKRHRGVSGLSKAAPRAGSESRRGGMGPIGGTRPLVDALIHPSAWNRNSPKFATIAPNKSPRRVSTRGS
jgi:hypothetical protein